MANRPVVTRIAMWSGPRNISTALMRSFENRGDTHVSDEPLYASYLARTGYEHPGRDEILASQCSDVTEVFRELAGPVPGDRPIWYQKQMSHHLPSDLDVVPLAAFRHVLLIRDPGEMLTSLVRIIPEPTAHQTGLPQQCELWRRLAAGRGGGPPVIDAADILSNPERMLRKLCDLLGIDFRPTMLSWPAGRRPTDGVWAKHWYGNVEQSTGFGPHRPKREPVPGSLTAVLDHCRRCYDQLAAYRLR